MTTIHLVRHGEVDNPEGILYGRIPGFGLTERGHEMARRVGEHFAQEDNAPDALVASPLLRAQQTIAPLAENLDMPVFTDDRTKPAPFPKQSAWEFYSNVKDHVVYIHVKDGIWDGQKANYTYPGLGEGDVRRIVEDALRSGYDGGISIEPHIGAVFHDDTVKTDDDRRYAMYVEYGRRMEAMIADIRKAL